MSRRYIEKLAELDREGGPFASVTMVDVVGSTPQERGAKMLVNGQGRVYGTVGGGKIEAKSIAYAQQLLQQPDSQVHHFVQWNLQRDVGMTCGGVVRLFFEVFNTKPWRIVVFGAGHVAQALIRCLLPLDCYILCIDPRAEWLKQLPECDRLEVRHADELAAEVPTLRDDDYVLCMTMGHKTDRPVLERIFRDGRCFSYLGVIGSRSKRSVLVRELQAAGFDRQTAEQFRCPIGLPIGNNQPAEIAISVAAELLQCRTAATTPQPER